VAEFIGGSADVFVDLMNIRAKELGLLNTTFANEHGLPPDPGQEENDTTAYDMALLGRELVKYPKILTWTSTLEDTFRNGTFTLTNTNRQLLRNYRGLDGLKTGFHPRGAAFSVCATAQRNDRRLLAVVMGAPQKTDRYKAVTELLNMGFTQFERVVVLQKGFTAGDPVPVLQGKVRSAHLVASDNVVVLVKKGQKDLVRQKVNISVQSIQAPAPQGASFGEVTVFVDDEPVTTVDLVLEEALEKGLLIDRIKWWIVNKIS
jgi:D-alanyl-D-alanine carboxypeptidase (penicillin-binding protein 5/6)